MRYRTAFAGALALVSCNKSLSFNLHGGGSSSGGSSSAPSAGGGGGGGGGGAETAQGVPTPAPAPAMKSACALREAKLALGKDYQQDAPIVGDFNGDGKLDVAFSEMLGRSDTRYKPSGDLRTFLGNGDGTFGNPIITPLPITDDSWQPESAAGDFDGDGKLDIVLADRNDGPFAYMLLLGKGNGTFAKPIAVKSPGTFEFYNLQVADLDGDKRSDLIASAKIDDKASGIVVFHGKAGGLGKPAMFTAPGKKDLGYELAYRDKFVWRVADMDATGALSFVAATNGIAAIDFDRDSGAGNYGVCAIKLTKKHTLEAAQCSESTEDFQAETVALADFNGDGHLDIATGPEPHSFMSTTRQLDVVLDTAKGAIEKKRRKIAANVEELNTFWALDAGDVTGDGKADIIAVGQQSRTSNTIALVVTGKGDGTFPSSFIATTNYQANANAADVRFGAFQGPGSLGFAISAWEGPESYVHVYSGKCAR